jgi:hypothetical protein
VIQGGGPEPGHASTGQRLNVWLAVVQKAKSCGAQDVQGCGHTPASWQGNGVPPPRCIPTCGWAGAHRRSPRLRLPPSRKWGSLRAPPLTRPHDQPCAGWICANLIAVGLRPGRGFASPEPLRARAFAPLHPRPPLRRVDRRQRLAVGSLSLVCAYPDVDTHCSIINPRGCEGSTYARKRSDQKLDKKHTGDMLLPNMSTLYAGLILCS